MNTYRRNLLATGILMAALLAYGAMAAAASTTVKITNCVKASARPKSVTLTCGDGNTVLSGLRWSSFGGPRARARGTFETNTCEPNCAAGKVVRYPVSVSATTIRRCKAGLRVYDKVTLQFTGRAPASSGGSRHWTLGCPT